MTKSDVTTPEPQGDGDALDEVRRLAKRLAEAEEAHREAQKGLRPPVITTLDSGWTDIAEVRRLR